MIIIFLNEINDKTAFLKEFQDSIVYLSSFKTQSWLLMKDNVEDILNIHLLYRPQLFYALSPVLISPITITRYNALNNCGRWRIWMLRMSSTLSFINNHDCVLNEDKYTIESWNSFKKAVLSLISFRKMIHNWLYY